MKESQPNTVRSSPANRYTEISRFVITVCWMDARQLEQNQSEDDGL